MATVKETLYYRKDPDTGDLALIEAVRPSMKFNSLGPLTVGQAVQLTVKKGAATVIDFQYTVDKAITAEKGLYAVLRFEFSEISDQLKAATLGKSVALKDAEMHKKEFGAKDAAFDSVLRPRNVSRQNLGPFEVGTVCSVDFLIDSVSQESMEYTVGQAVTEGNILVGNLHLDFVEV